MPFEHLETLQRYAPPEGTTSVTPTIAASYGAGTYTQAIASVGADAVITNLIANLEDAFGNFHYEFEIGVGAAGSEVVAATVVTAAVIRRNNPGEIPFLVGIDRVLSGQRLAVRGRRNVASTTTAKVAVGYMHKPLSGQATTTTEALTRTPVSGTISVTPNATAWANSAYTELIAATATAWLVQHLAWTASVVGPGSFEFDISTGAAGAETVVETIRGGATGGGVHQILPVSVLFDGIASGVRVAIRVRKDGTSTAVHTIAVARWPKDTF